MAIEMLLIHLVRFLLVICLTLFPYFTYRTFYQARLEQKNKEYGHINKALNLGQSEGLLSTIGVEIEYSKSDYRLPIAFACLLSFVGFFALFYGMELRFARHESFLLSGIFSGTANEIEVYQNASLSALTMAFLGAYTWGIQNIFRRLVTLDLNPGTYYQVGIRIVLSALLALAYRHLIVGSEVGLRLDSLPVAAFLTGMFPERMLFHLKEWLPIFSDSKSKRADDLPLEMIQGISIHHRLRLSEVGIDNAQNLAMSNLIALLIKTPFNPKNLIDWIGQAKLYIHFKSSIDNLRECGIRTIFNFKDICNVQGELEKISKCSGIDLTHLEAVYQIIKEDPDIERLQKAVIVFSEDGRE